MKLNDVKRIDLKEFLEAGFLQEVNRQFFHPMGLALEVVEDTDTGEVILGGIWDYRDDPEGMIFGDEIAKSDERKEKAKRINELFESKRAVREENFGWHIQPMGE